MVCVSTRKHLQPDSDPVVQLGQMGRGKWHQMAEGGSLPPFHKGGLRLPPGLRAPKMTSPAGLGEVPTAARPRGLARSLSPTSQTPPAPREGCWQLHTRGDRGWQSCQTCLIDSFQGGQEGEVCKTTKQTKEGARATGGRNKGV